MSTTLVLFLSGLSICAGLVSPPNEEEDSSPPVLRDEEAGEGEAYDDGEYDRPGEAMAEMAELGLNVSHPFVLVLNKKPKANRKPVMWVHIHKNAGGTLCRAAQQHERVVSPEDGTCNSPDLHDTFFPDGLMARPSWSSCAARTAYFRRHGFTWGQIEREFSPSDYCPKHFLYAVALRDPVERTESYINWNMKKVAGNKFRDWASCITAKNASQCPKSERMMKNKMEARNFGYIEWDNFQVRSLGGYETMSLPPGALNQTHLDRAIELLEKFAVVVAVERIGEAETQRKMDAALGWHIETNQNRDHVNHHKIKLTAHAKKTWESVNALDRALYDHFAPPRPEPVSAPRDSKKRHSRKLPPAEPKATVHPSQPKQKRPPPSEASEERSTASVQPRPQRVEKPKRQKLRPLKRIREGMKKGMHNIMR